MARPGTRVSDLLDGGETNNEAILSLFDDGASMGDEDSFEEFAVPPETETVTVAPPVYIEAAVAGQAADARPLPKGHPDQPDVVDLQQKKGGHCMPEEDRGVEAPLIPPPRVAPALEYGGQFRNQAKKERPKVQEYAYKRLACPEASYKSYKRQVIAVHSPKGGVGKTTLTKELAFGYSSATVNGEPLKVAVIDGDWEFGDVAIQFDITPVPNVSDWARAMRRDRELHGKIPLYSYGEINDRYLIHYSDTIDVLCGSLNSMDAQLLDSEIVAAIIDNLRKVGNYDIILIDNANSLKDTTIVPLMKADTVVLITTLDTTTIQDIRNMLDTLLSLQFDYSKIRLVLNNVPNDDKKLDIAVAEIPRVLTLELAAVIPNYDPIRLYNNSGEAAVLDKDTPFSKEVKRLANSIMPVFDTKPKGFLARLFSRLKKGR